jgi:hypothetical protein
MWSKVVKGQWWHVDARSATAAGPDRACRQVPPSLPTPGAGGHAHLLAWQPRPSPACHQVPFHHRLFGPGVAAPPLTCRPATRSLTTTVSLVLAASRRALASMTSASMRCLARRFSAARGGGSMAQACTQQVLCSALRRERSAGMCAVWRCWHSHVASLDEPLPPCRCLPTWSCQAAGGRGRWGHPPATTAPACALAALSVARRAPISALRSATLSRAIFRASCTPACVCRHCA